MFLGQSLIRSSSCGLVHSQSKYQWAFSVTCPTACSSIGSLIHWMTPGIEPASSWIIVRFVTCWFTMGTPYFIFTKTLWGGPGSGWITEVKNFNNGRKCGGLDSTFSSGRWGSTVFEFCVVSGKAGKAELSSVPFPPHHADLFSF